VAELVKLGHVESALVPENDTQLKERS
jgi:hypothetical protein